MRHEANVGVRRDGRYFPQEALLESGLRRCWRFSQVNYQGLIVNARFSWRPNPGSRPRAEVASPFRYGLPRLVVLLRRAGVRDNHKRIGRIYRAANLKVCERIRRKLALGRGIPPTRATRPNERWSVDFVHDRLRHGRRSCVVNYAATPNSPLNFGGMMGIPSQSHSPSERR